MVRTMPKKLKTKNDAHLSRYQLALDRAARQVILGAIAETGGNVTHAAPLLGISLRHLFREIARLELGDEIDREKL